MKTSFIYMYLRTFVSDADCKPEILSRIVQTTTALKVETDALPCISIFLYACGSWTLTAELEKRTQAFELRCYRRLLNVSYEDHVINVEVSRKIQGVIGECDELLTLVKKRKLGWFGHVSRSSGLAKTILQGTVKDKRR